MWNQRQLSYKPAMHIACYHCHSVAQGIVDSKASISRVVQSDINEYEMILSMSTGSFLKNRLQTPQPIILYQALLTLVGRGESHSRSEDGKKGNKLKGLHGVRSRYQI